MKIILDIIDEQVELLEYLLNEAEINEENRVRDIVGEKKQSDFDCLENIKDLKAKLLENY